MLHEIEISKIRKILGYVISIIPSLMLLMAGVLKILGVEEIVQNMSRIPNIGEIIFFIGVLEITCLVIYWVPKFSNIGFFLIAAYCGGIIVAEIVSGEMPIPGIVVAILFYVGTMLRKPSLSGLNI